MGSNRKLIFGAVLLVAALVFWGLLNARNNVQVAAAKPTPLPLAQQVNLPNAGRMIAYAASDIPQGTLVTKNMLQMRELPGTAPTAPFITDPQRQALGFVTSTAIPKGALIRPLDDFAGHISEVGIAGMLQPGKRAIVIPFANKPTLHDLVAIGNYVDINSAFDGQEARTIVPRVRVLAVDVFGSDFPQTNIARRGPYRAELPGSGAPAPGEAAPAPGTTPTPTPAPAQAPARPDPAITLEVTPEQANRILLAQASGGVLDFVVLPTTGDPSTVPGGADTPGTTPEGQPIGEGVAQLVSAVTRPQLAPFAERKKLGNTGSTRTASTGGGDGNGGGRRSPRLRAINTNFGPPPVIPSAGVTSGGSLGPAAPTSFPTPAPTAESPTYNIPIYSDGRAVRIETVPRPQE